VSIVGPFFLATLLALFLYPRLSDASVTFNEVALFMGGAMSITAFPVLARILAEEKIQHTTLGSVALACAAVDDVTGWCVLPYIVIVIRAHEISHSLWMIVVGSDWFRARDDLWCPAVAARLRNSVQPTAPSKRESDRPGCPAGRGFRLRDRVAEYTCFLVPS
jgi:hypothetical protein